MTQYLNPKKVERAKEELRKSGRPITDEAIKTLYLKYGGAIVGEEETFKGVDEDSVIPEKVENGKVVEIKEKPGRKKR